MDPDAQPAVFKCIIPVKKPVAASPIVYHSLISDNKRQIFYPAWPDIDDPHNPCCLPFLMRAIYSSNFHFGAIVKPDDALAIAQEYVSRPEVMATMTPEVCQQVLALLKAQPKIVECLLWVKSLSAMGGYIKKGQRPAVARNVFTEFFRGFLGKQVSQIMLTGTYGLMQGHLKNFPGAVQGDFNSLYSYSHESVHNFARILHSGTLLEKLSERTHNLLYTLAAKRLSQKRIAELWEQFQETNTYMIQLAKKFALIEELFATFLGIYFMPPDLRGTVKPEIDEMLNEKGWTEAYKDFLEASTRYKNTYINPSIFVFEAVCRILEQVDIDGAKLLNAFAQIRKVIWSHIKNIEQENNNSLDEAILETMAGCEAAEEVNQILDQAGISREIYYSAVDMDNNFYKKVNQALETGSLPTEEDMEILFAPSIKLEGRPSQREITPLIFSVGFQQKGKGKLSPSNRIFCESLRQQISSPCGLVCPFASKGKSCCGKEKMLQRLYDRVPENMKAEINKPNCEPLRKS